jgi:UDP-2-acetamido-2-deoxy-ribo-hexuluronate aminotransferase
MDSIQCAVVLAKLERFDWEIGRRMAIGKRYDALLASHVRTLQVRPDRTSVYAQYTVRARDRAALESRLRAKGIPTAIHYPLALHQQPAYAELSPDAAFPAAERLAREVISLPMHPYLTEAAQDRVVEAVSQVL